MKPVLENVFREKEQLIKASKYKLPYFKYPYHYHPEYEITYIVKSEGKMYIADKTLPFKEGELTFVGPSVPHAWINSKEFYSGQKTVSAIVIQFNNLMFPPAILRSQEFVKLANLLKYSQRCIKICAIDNTTLRLLEGICNANPEYRYIMLLQLMTEMASMNSYEFILDDFEVNNHQIHNKYDKLLTYIYNNISEITLDRASDYMGMNKSALCRYIKKTGIQTFSELVNQVRIKNACILLRETDLNINEIAFETGFSSTSYFVRVFRTITGKSPTGYRVDYLA